MSVSRPCRRRSPLALAGLVSMAAAIALGGCTEVETESSTGYEPAALEPVKGSEDLQKVTFTAEGARRVGLETAEVSRSGKRLVVPYAALLYDPQGKTYVYRSPKRLEYIRAPVEVDRIAGGRVLLKDGPPVGTRVVTVGVTEVYGTELEVPSH
jgi:hypothetical protein